MSEMTMSLREAARVLGAAGGRVKSAKKAKAVRENGKKGGRPRGRLQRRRNPEIL